MTAIARRVCLLPRRTLAVMVLMACGGIGAVGQGLEADSVDRLLDRSFKERERQPEQALAWANTALGWAQEHNDSVRLADAWRKVSLALHESISTLDSSFTSMERALSISSAIHDQKGEQSAAKSLGKWYHEKGDFSKALEYAGRSLRVAEVTGDRKGTCSALVTLGGAQKGLGDPEAAATSYYKALVIARELADAIRTGDLLNNLGNLYFELGRLDQAEGYYIQQKEHARMAGLAAAEADAVRNLGMVAAARGEFQIALGRVDTALKLMEVAGVPMEDRLVAMNHRGHYLLELGRLSDARVVLDSVLRTTSKWHHEEDRSYILSDLGTIDLREGRFARSDSLFQAALMAAGQSLVARMGALRNLATLSERQGLWKEAQSYLSAHIAASDSFINAEATDQLARAEMRQKYKAHEQEAEIMDLGERMAKERVLRNMALGITLLALVLAILAWRNWRFQRELRMQAGIMHGQEVSQLLKQQEIRALDAVLRGQELERTRIARDLHDRVGSLLSAVKMQFGALEERMARVEDTAGVQYERVAGLLDTAVGEVRRISHDMEHGTLASFGLAAALEDLRDALDVPGRLRVELNTFGLDSRLEKRLEIAAYRMVQEAVSNALKHAKPGRLDIQVTRSPAYLNILVEDDGTGFDTEQAAPGMGLSNLRARAAELGGTVDLDSRPGRGTTVVIDLPLPEGTP